MDIRIGAAPAELTSPRARRGAWQAAPGIFLMTVEGVARYLVREGREITVEPAGKADEAVTAFLLGSVLAACLKQRGVLTLHAGSLSAGGGAVLFAGHSGSGKSTLLAALLERGHTLLGDDVAGIAPDGGARFLALPAYPSLRLWGDAIRTFGWEGRVQGPVRKGLEKYWVPARRFHESPLPVRAVFVLGRNGGDTAEIRALPRAAAFRQLLRHTYRKRYAHGLGREREQFRALAALAGSAPVAALAQPAERPPAEALADRVEACLRDGRLLRANGGEKPARRAGAKRRRLSPAPRKAPPESAAGPIVWLASYPRSGNTWLRAFLTNYLRDAGDCASINALAGGSDVIRREVFDEHLGLSSSDLTPAEVLRLRPRLHMLVGAELPRPSFVKVHDACVRTGGGTLLFPPAVSLGAIYLVRNPLDVAVSSMHFWNWPAARSVAELCRPEAVLSQPAGGLHPVLPQPLRSWSGHVESWLNQGELPVHAVRYEDMLADPGAAFGAILRFAGIEPDGARLGRAVEHSRFTRLRAQEERCGFAEKPPTARFFFRSGRAGTWRDTLSRGEVRLLIDAHGPLMERFGYLSAARAFLSGRP